MINLIENDSGAETRNDEIRKELEVIASRKAGLNPTTLLAVAKNPRSTLHNYFTWDDSEAARRFREMQAYELIRRVRVCITTASNETMTIRAFWPVKTVERDGTIDNGKRGNYLRIDDAMNSGEASRQILARAKGELQAFSEKYRALAHCAEMMPVFSAIKKVLPST